MRSTSFFFFINYMSEKDEPGIGGNLIVKPGLVSTHSPFGARRDRKEGNDRYDVFVFEAMKCLAKILGSAMN